MYLFRLLLSKVKFRQKISFLSYHLDSLRQKLFSSAKLERHPSFHSLKRFQTSFRHFLLDIPSRLSRCVNHSYFFKKQVLFLLQE